MWLAHHFPWLSSSVSAFSLAVPYVCKSWPLFLAINWYLSPLHEHVHMPSSHGSICGSKPDSNGLHAIAQSLPVHVEFPAGVSPTPLNCLSHRIMAGASTSPAHSFSSYLQQIAHMSTLTDMRLVLKGWCLCDLNVVANSQVGPASCFSSAASSLMLSVHFQDQVEL